MVKNWSQNNIETISPIHHAHTFVMWKMYYNDIDFVVEYSKNPAML